jgi:hypothetical protein
MTRKIIFTEIVMRSWELIQEDGTLLDVDLMIRLDFSPPSWKIWKPKIIEKLTSVNLRKISEEEGNKNWIKITYDKKSTLWKASELIEQYN